jgi:hypothetical protein
VFRGAGDELGQALPLLPFIDGLRVREPSANPRRNRIVRLLRGEIPVDRGADVPAMLAEQLLVARRRRVRRAASRPGDRRSAVGRRGQRHRVGRLARFSQQLPLLLIGTIRPVPQRQDLSALRRAVDKDARIRLTGLTRMAVADLVAVLAGGKPDDNLLRLADDAAGNPLYVTELVAALARGPALVITGTGAAKLGSGPVPGSLSAAIADRLGFATGSVREVLRAAALLGVEFAVPDLATVLGRGVADLIPAVDEACAAGVLASAGSRRPSSRANRRPEHRAVPCRARRRAGRRRTGSAPAGDRAVLPGPAGPRRRLAGGGGRALRGRQQAADARYGARGGGRGVRRHR